MKKQKLRGLWLIALGALLTLAALGGLFRQPSVLQYAIVAPAEAGAEGEGGSRLKLLIDGWKSASKELSEALSASSIAARDYGFSLSSDAGQSGIATLTAVGEHWFSVYPKYLSSGRLPVADELKNGDRVAVLDEELAFKLFPTGDPLAGKVLVGETWYRVVGTVRHPRSVGDFEQYAAYIPIARAAAERLPFETVEAAGAPIAKSGASQAFSEAAERWALGGTFVDLDKEVLRETMILRLLAIVFGFFALFSLLRRLNRRVAEKMRSFRERLRTSYFRSMLPEFARWALLHLVGYAALLGGGYALLTLAIGPMYVFTEWIPDVLVELSSILERFWQLTSSAAKPVFVRTREWSEIRFLAGMLRWGAVAMLAGFVALFGGLRASGKGE
ncbi:MAG: ABC transporter permease [Clostridiales bacterium]|nr:ABC transporter permease [Clostridiales bacterium]